MGTENLSGDKTMIRSYFNSQAETWDEMIAEKDGLKLAKMADGLAIAPGSAVLDVGTGTGVFIPFLLDKIGSHGKLVCLDIAEKMLEKARRKNYTGNLEFVCGDIAKTHFENESFDAVVCYSSFPHFQDKPVCLREIRRILKKGGRLFICHTSSRSEINEIHGRIPGLEADLLPDNADMLEILSASGFRKIELQDEAGSYLAVAV